MWLSGYMYFQQPLTKSSKMFKHILNIKHVSTPLIVNGTTDVLNVMYVLCGSGACIRKDSSFPLCTAVGLKLPANLRSSFSISPSSLSFNSSQLDPRWLLCQTPEALKALQALGQARCCIQWVLTKAFPPYLFCNFYSITTTYRTTIISKENHVPTATEYRHLHRQ